MKKLKGLSICFHGFYYFENEHLPRWVLRKIVIHHGGIFKESPSNSIDIMVMGKHNAATGVGKRSKPLFAKRKKIRQMSDSQFSRLLTSLEISKLKRKFMK